MRQQPSRDPAGRGRHLRWTTIAWDVHPPHAVTALGGTTSEAASNSCASRTVGAVSKDIAVLMAFFILCDATPGAGVLLYRQHRLGFVEHVTFQASNERSQLLFFRPRHVAFL